MVMMYPSMHWKKELIPNWKVPRSSHLTSNDFYVSFFRNCPCLLRGTWYTLQSDSRCQAISPKFSKMWAIKPSVRCARQIGPERLGSGKQTDSIPPLHQLSLSLRSNQSDLKVTARSRPIITWYHNSPYWFYLKPSFQHHSNQVNFGWIPCAEMANSTKPLLPSLLPRLVDPLWHKVSSV